MFRSISLAAVFFAVLAVAPPLAQAQGQAMKVGLVDFQRALNETAEGKKARATLELRYESSRLELESKRAELQQMKENIEAQGVMLSPGALAEKEQEYQKEMLAFQQVLLESQQEMALMEQELTFGIYEKLKNTADGIGREAGFNLILHAEAVVYLNGVVDITDQVITRFNQK